MTDREFRFAYFTPRYYETVEFYRDWLELPIAYSWDRSPDDKGTLVTAASGLIEVLAQPSVISDHHFDKRPAQGAFVVIEVEDVDAFYRRIAAKGLTFQQELQSQSWSHRSFCIREPNGLTLYFFTKV